MLKKEIHRIVFKRQYRNIFADHNVKCVLIHIGAEIVVGIVFKLRQQVVLADFLKVHQHHARIEIIAALFQIKLQKRARFQRTRTDL